MTVLAWCLMASTGRVSSSMARVSDVGEVLDHDARRADLAVLDLVGLERQHAEGVAEQRRRGAPRCWPRGGRRSRRCAARRRSATAGGSSAGPSSASRSSPARGGPGRDGRLDGGPRLAQRAGLGVDGQRGLVAEEVPGHRRQHEGQARVGGRHDDDLQRGREPLLALAGDHDRRGLVGPVDRDLLGHVVGGRAGEAGRADQDQRLGREVDVLLVLGRVAGDRLVAELGQLDPHLVRRRCG